MQYASLSYLAEDFRLQVYEFLREAAPLIEPFTLKVLETYRDPAAQDADAAAGKSKACFGASPHNCCSVTGFPIARAFDFGIFDIKGQYITQGINPHYAICGNLAVKMGMEWGGNWTQQKDNCEPDYDHIQQADWRNKS